MNRSFALHFVLSGVLFLSVGRAFGSPGPHQHRIPQTIIVNGQQAEGVTVIQNGSAPKFYCPNPRPYTAVDQSSSGWACFDANTGSWLLNAMPPASANVPEGTSRPVREKPSAGPVSGPPLPAEPDSRTAPASANVCTKRRHHHAAPYDQYNYAYPDYTYYPEDFFAGRTGQAGHDGGHHK